MTTKPKANRYRVSQPNAAQAVAKASGELPEATASNAPDAPAAAAAQPAVVVKPAAASPAAATAAPDSDEKFTPRQLRIARRIAEKHGLEVTSDLEAIHVLRSKGIDPFQKNHIVELALAPQQNKPNNAGGAVQEQPVQLPQKREADKPPSNEVISADRRAHEIRKIQREIARRRRIRFGLLVARLTLFIFIPTAIAWFYFATIATPLYTTKSDFIILNAEGGGGMGGFGGLMPSQFATGQDSIATQSYLESKDAMLRLDREYGFRDHFSGPNIDPIQRLPENASNETAYKAYKRHVKLGYDQTEGVIRMEVSTADPELSLEFSKALIKYAEERVDDLSKQKREDAVKIATQSLDEAKEERRKAQENLVKLQEDSILDPEGAIGNIRSLIASAEQELQTKELALKAQETNSRPNKARVEALQNEVAILKEELEKQNARLTHAKSGFKSLAAQTGQLRMAEADLATADLILQSALEAKRQSEIEANKQVRYLTISVKPLASQEPSYPKVFEDTFLAFLIFSGIYLMLSLTASILREQVSS